MHFSIEELEGTSIQEISVFGWLVEVCVFRPTDIEFLEDFSPGVFLGETTTEWFIEQAIGPRAFLERYPDCERIWMLNDDSGSLGEVVGEWLVYQVKAQLEIPCEPPPFSDPAIAKKLIGEANCYLFAVQSVFRGLGSPIENLRELGSPIEGFEGRSPYIEITRQANLKRVTHPFWVGEVIECRQTENLHALYKEERMIGVIFIGLTRQGWQVGITYYQPPDAYDGSGYLRVWLFSLRIELMPIALCACQQIGGILGAAFLGSVDGDFSENTHAMARGHVGLVLEIIKVLQNET